KPRDRPARQCQSRSELNAAAGGTQRPHVGSTTLDPSARARGILPFLCRTTSYAAPVFGMALKLFNTLTRSVQEFVPLDPGGKSVAMYCCGPTVYDFGHIGNFRTFVFSDLVRRYLEFRGFTVRHVMNITDVEDKIIARVREAKVSLREYTGKFEAAFVED